MKPFEEKAAKRAKQIAGKLRNDIPYFESLGGRGLLNELLGHLSDVANFAHNECRALERDLRNYDAGYITDDESPEGLNP